MMNNNAIISEAFNKLNKMPRMKDSKKSLKESQNRGRNDYKSYILNSLKDSGYSNWAKYSDYDFIGIQPWVDGSYNVTIDDDAMEVRVPVSMSIEKIVKALTSKGRANKYKESYRRRLKEGISKKEFINAYIDSYGGTVKDASKQFLKWDESSKKELVNGFKNNSKKSFLTDSLNEDMYSSSLDPEIVERVRNYIDSNLDHFLVQLTMQAETKIPGYDSSWGGDDGNTDVQMDFADAFNNLVDCMVPTFFENYPDDEDDDSDMDESLNKRLKENSGNTYMTPAQNRWFIKRLDDLGYTKEEASYQLQEFADDFDGIDDYMVGVLMDLASKLDSDTLTKEEAVEVIEQLEV